MTDFPQPYYLGSMKMEGRKNWHHRDRLKPMTRMASEENPHLSCLRYIKKQKLTTQLNIFTFPRFTVTFCFLQQNLCNILIVSMHKKPKYERIILDLLTKWVILLIHGPPNSFLKYVSLGRKCFFFLTLFLVKQRNFLIIFFINFVLLT